MQGQLQCGCGGKRSWRPSIEYAGEQVDCLVIQNLDEDHVRDFLTDTLDADYLQVQGLSTLVYSMTQGNPMFMVTLLSKMQSKG